MVHGASIGGAGHETTNGLYAGELRNINVPKA